jgi:acyl dehydratase
MTAALARQRSYDDVAIDDEIGAVEYPLTVYRLVVAAGGNRDFNSIHHNSSYAKASGAPDMYASTFFLLGCWERVVRDYIGSGGTIRSISGFRMRKFNVVGSVMTVSGRVVDRRIEAGRGVVELELVSRVGDEVAVGPGRVVVTLPITARGSDD